MQPGQGGPQRGGADPPGASAKLIHGRGLRGARRAARAIKLR